MNRDSISKQIREHLSSSLVQNAYIIMAMRIFTGATGLLFWVATARLMPARDVGLASAAVLAATLLAGLAQLGFGYGLVRHLPEAPAPARLVNAVLWTVTAAGLALVVVFLLGLRFWSPALAPLLTNVEAILSFVLLVISTALTQVLNWQLLARKASVYLLLKNSLQNGLCLVFLFPFALRGEGWPAAVHANTLSTIASLLLTVLVFVPRSEPGFRLRIVLPRTIRTPFASYSLTNFFADQFSRLTGTVTPLLVTNVLGAELAAYFFVVFSLYSGFVSINESVSTSLFAEGANDRASLAGSTWRSVRLTLGMASLVMLGTLLFSRLILLFYGSRYVTYGFWPLVIVAVALVPASLMPIYGTYLRVRDRLRTLVAYSGADIGLGILGVYLWMRLTGLNGAALGWLASRFIMAALTVVMMRQERRHTPVSSPAPLAAQPSGPLPETQAPPRPAPGQVAASGPVRAQAHSRGGRRAGGQQPVRQRTGGLLSAGQRSAKKGSRAARRKQRTRKEPG
jgi:O-antigen/teichoic acid export membrane protein